MEKTLGYKFVSASDRTDMHPWQESCSNDCFKDSKYVVKRQFKDGWFHMAADRPGYLSIPDDWIVNFEK